MTMLTNVKSTTNYALGVINLCKVLLLSMPVLVSCTTAKLEPHVSHALPQKVMAGRQGMSVAAHPEATSAANRILLAGGNAADAAVAAGFAISVVEPTMNSIGGRSQVLVRTADGDYFAINGMTEIPAGYVRPEQPDKDGYRVIATPGVVAALACVHEEHGSLPWKTLLQPAIEIAERGYTLLPGGAVRHELGFDAIKDNAGFQENILINGRTYVEGEKLVQSNLAQTLRQIADGGAAAFYQGDIAKVIASDIESNGGFVTLADLKKYKALDGRYISTTYRDFEVHSIAAPAGGGLVVKALNILENFDLETFNDLEWAAVVNQALALSIQTMQVDYEESDLSIVASKHWAKETSEKIKVPNLVDLRTAIVGIGAESSLRGTDKFDWAGDSWGSDSHHTTHFVTADCAGMTVSITQTIGPLFGSKVITPSLGFAYASTMGTYLSSAAQSPGSRPRTTIAPTIVTKDGEVVMVLGAAGGLRILSGIVQTISRYVDQDMSLEDAVAAPRIHPATSTDAAGTRRIEPMSFHAELTESDGWQESDIEIWESAGFAVEPNTRQAAFARVHAIGKSGGMWRGAADLDWEGSVQTPVMASCEL